MKNLTAGQYLVMVPVVFMQPTIVSGCASALEAAHKAVALGEDCEEVDVADFSHVSQDHNMVAVISSDGTETREAWEDFEE